MARSDWLNRKIRIHPRFFLLLLIPAVVLTVIIMRANARIAELEAEIDRKQEEILQIYAETEELERRIAFMDTDEYIEQEARREFGLLGEDEIRFVAGSELGENTKEMLAGKKHVEQIAVEESEELSEQPVTTPTPTMGTGS